MRMLISVNITPGSRYIASYISIFMPTPTHAAQMRAVEEMVYVAMSCRARYDGEFDARKYYDLVDAAPSPHKVVKCINAKMGERHRRIYQTPQVGMLSSRGRKVAWPTARHRC